MCAGTQNLHQLYTKHIVAVSKISVRDEPIGYGTRVLAEVSALIHVVSWTNITLFELVSENASIIVEVKL